MKWIPVIIVAALTFGVLFLLDKGFTKLFRNQAQHKSGCAVRLNKRYASFGLILCVLGIASMLSAPGEGWIMLAAGGIILAVGIGLVIYYMTFGVFYNEDSFVLTTFGRKSRVYFYKQIKGQVLYNSSGNIVIELHMDDGRTFHLPVSLDGVYPFMDHAFARWCEQSGIAEEDCDFHDPSQSCWFVNMEE